MRQSRVELPERAAVILYRLLVSLFAAITLLREWRAGGWARVAARLGRGPVAPGPHLWWHGASMGELASSRPVLTALLAARPDLRVLVTANTETGRAMVAGWALPGVSARLAPLDLARMTARTMRRWQVVAHVTLESELWPHRVRLCPGPVIALGARMTDGTAKVWRRMSGLARRILGRMAFVSAQDPASLDRLLALGLTPSAAGPVVDLKAFYSPPTVTPEARLGAAFPRDATWLAASTHEGEDATILEAHRRARAAEPALRLILAPRHPHRADTIAALARAEGLRVAIRSRAEPPERADVYLADTLGEMALWYGLAGRVFIGGSLVAKGGHTPYEPAAFGAALILGPDMRNFRAAADRLSGLAPRAGTAETLANALTALAPPDAQRSAGDAARKALRPDAGPDALVAALLPFVDGVRQS